MTNSIKKHDCTYGEFCPNQNCQSHRIYIFNENKSNEITCRDCGFEWEIENDKKEIG